MTDRTQQLRELAQRIADALPADVVEEVVLTGSVSRGAADDISDIEMLIVTAEQLELATCFEHARAAGLRELETWGRQDVPTRRVFGYVEGVPVELIWWSRELAETSIDELFRIDVSSSGDAIASGVPLRTAGALARWQARLREYPEELAAARIEEAALTWGGYHPSGLLTLARAGERLTMLDDVLRVLRIVYALNRVWEPTTKRLALRVAPLAVKPERLAERIEEALTEPDPRAALITITELQADTVALAPDGPNVNRARDWLAAGLDILRETPA